LAHAPDIYQFARNHSSGTKLSIVGAEILVAAMALGLPSLLMGATFSLLAQAWRDLRGNVASAAAINTAGAALAPLLFSILILPWLGAKWAFVAIAVGYFLLLPRLNKLVLSGLLLAAILLVALPRDLRI